MYRILLFLNNYSSRIRVLDYQLHFKQYFSYIMAVRTPNCFKSLTNVIAIICVYHDSRGLYSQTETCRMSKNLNLKLKSSRIKRSKTMKVNNPNNTNRPSDSPQNKNTVRMQNCITILGMVWKIFWGYNPPSSINIFLTVTKGQTLLNIQNNPEIATT